MELCVRSVYLFCRTEHCYFIGLKTCILWDIVAAALRRVENRRGLHFAIH